MIAIGHKSDSSASKYENIAGCQIGSLEPGTPVELFIDNGESFGGKYLGLNQYSFETYKKLYNDSVALNPKTLQIPKIDDTISIFYNDQFSKRSIFKGFGYKYNDEPSFIKNENLITSYFIRYGSPNNEKILKVPLSDLNTVINQDGDSLDGSIIRKSLLVGQLPVIDYAEIQLVLLNKPIQIPTIDSIQTLNDNKSSKPLVLIGLAVDVLIWDYFLHEIGRKAD